MIKVNRTEEALNGSKPVEACSSKRLPAAEEVDLGDGAQVPAFREMHCTRAPSPFLCFMIGNDRKFAPADAPPGAFRHSVLPSINPSAIQSFDHLPSPAFLIEEDKLRKNLELIADVAAAADVTIILALKAFAYWPAFPIVAEYLRGATASSLNEAQLIKRHFGKPPHVYAPVYQPHTFPQVAELAGHLTFNSLTELERYRSVWEPAGVNVGLRVNPEYSPVETALYNPANPHGRLGETLPNLPTKPPAGLRGLHVHTLCESSAEATATLIERTKAQFGHYLEKMEWLNLGGGHLMTREGYDVDGLIATLRALRARYPHLEVILEPGSAIAWQTGILSASVLDVVENYGTRTLMLDVSFTCHMPDTLEMPYRPTVRGAKAEATEGFDFAYRLGGMSCLAGDALDEYYFPQPVRPGDRIIFEDMAHYTTVKTTMFNGVPHPDICLVDANDEIIARRTFTYEDYEGRMG